MAYYKIFKFIRRASNLGLQNDNQVTVYDLQYTAEHSIGWIWTSDLSENHSKGSFQNTWNAQKIHNAQNNTQKKYEEKRLLRKLRK